MYTNKGQRRNPANQGFHKYVFSVVSRFVAYKFAPWEWNIKFNELFNKSQKCLFVCATPCNPSEQVL